MPKFRVEARNNRYERVGVVEQYLSLDVISRFNGVGAWTLVVPADSQAAEVLQPGGGVIIWIEGLDRPVMSGPITSVNQSWSKDQPGSGQITYTGVSDETILWSRVTLPVPEADIMNQTVDRFTMSNTAAAALYTLVNKNAGPQARTDRIVPNLDMALQSFGRHVDVSTRFDVLGVKLQELAAATGLGWRLRQGTADRLTFEVFTPRVHDQGQVRFSPGEGTLASFEYGLTAPTATRFVVAAQGEGKYRWLTQYDEGTAKTLNNTNPQVQYSAGDWTYVPNRKVGDWFNDIHRNTKPGGTATFTFEGTGVAWLTERTGIAITVEVFLDGVSQGVKSVGSPSGTQYQAIGWQVADLPYGTHQLKLVAVSGALIVDGFRITGLPSVAGEWTNTPLETFIDRRDIPIMRGNDGSPINPEVGQPLDPQAITQLDQAADEAVIEAAARAQLSITPIDVPNLRYGIDYEVGDVVTVDLGTKRITDVLREVHLKDGAEGPSVQPVIGTEGASATPGLYREMRKLWNSLRKLEARR
ncbi:hypothetical protein ACFWY5_29850 [Nonomuraea sp. NPDC059007]|uniref:Gp37-like protein n=1 Tax=Nonomuraea sp. NPDC059007 TaxID=3346692 RepID=UPI003689A98D